jgi:hypothetical protein
VGLTCLLADGLGKPVENELTVQLQ